MTQPTSAKLLWMLCRSILYLLLGQILIVSYTMDYNHVLSPILTTTNTLYDIPVSVELTYLNVLSTRRQHILFSKYHNFLSLYNHSDFIKMHMHNAWLFRKSNLTIELQSHYFTKPKYIFMFCGTLTPNQICDNRDANSFDFHWGFFAASYLMIRDSFMLQMLKGSVPCHFVWTIPSYLLCTHYWTLNLIFLIPKLGLNCVLNFTFMTLFVLWNIFCTKHSDTGF